MFNHQWSNAIVLLLSSDTQSTARLPTRYQAVTYSPIYQPAPPMPGAPFQGIPVCNIGSVHTIQAPITVFQTNSLPPQVAPNVQQILVKNTTVGKTAGMAQGPNGVIQPIYPAPMFGKFLSYFEILFDPAAFFYYISL